MGPGREEEQVDIFLSNFNGAFGRVMAMRGAQREEAAQEQRTGQCDSSGGHESYMAAVRVGLGHQQLPDLLPFVAFYLPDVIICLHQYL